MKKLFMHLIFARAKEHRTSYTEWAVPIVERFAKIAGVNIKTIDTRTTGITTTSRELTTQKKKKISRSLSQADGFILVAPEYNHGYPGELKIFLDSFYDEFNRKPVGIIGVSNGGIGGARMVEQLRLVTIALQMVPINAVIHFSNSPKLFDAHGSLIPEQSVLYKKRFSKFFEELVWYASALKKARKK